MKQYHKNPRQITKKQFAKLEESLKELGDLSGIVHDLNSDELIGGNMRSRVFDINQCQTEIVTKNEQPDEQGTVAQGFVIWNGKRHAYRQVRWTAEQCERANLAANNLGGSWEWQELSGWDKATLEWAGFDADLLGTWNNDALNLRTMLTEEIDEASAFGALPDEDRAPFQQMTFTLHDTQAEQVREALKAAKAAGAFVDSENENSNGNALARICETYITEHGNS